MGIVSVEGQDRFAQELGVAFLEASLDQAICRLHVRPEHRNALGGIHGGVIFSLADIAFAAASNAGDCPYVGLQADIKYMAAAKDDVLTATAKRVGGSRNFAYYQVSVTDGQQNCIALFTASAYRVGTPPPRQ